VQKYYKYLECANFCKKNTRFCAFFSQKPQKGYPKIAEFRSYRYAPQGIRKVGEVEADGLRGTQPSASETDAPLR